VASSNQISGGEERGIPGATTRKKTRVGTFAVFFVVIIAFIGVIGFSIIAVNRLTATRLQEKDAEKKARADKLAAGDGQTKDLKGTMSQIKRDEDQKRAAEAATAASELAVPAGAKYSTGPTGIATSGAAGSTEPNQFNQGAQSSPENAKQSLEMRRLSGDVALAPASDAKGQDAQASALQSTLDAIKGMSGKSDGAAMGTSGGGTKNDLEESLTPSKIEDGKASLLPNLDYLLQRGYLIRCGLITRIVSTWPGAVKCTVLQDVYSANGHTVLIRAGATAFGEARKALMQGQARQFVLWDEIDDGQVKITLDSPAADSLGGSGIEAYVDNHFAQRFGGAMLVSLVSDFGQALANKTVGGGSGTVQLSGTSSTASGAAEEALKATINIPPTAYTNQGAITNIFVARHIDLSSVYKVVNDE
jgi:type IV secretion system protein VirB10